MGVLCTHFLLLCHSHSALLGSNEALRNHYGVTEWHPSEVGLMASLFRRWTLIISMPALATHTHPNHTGLLSKLLFSLSPFLFFFKAPLLRLESSLVKKMVGIGPSIYVDC